MVGFVKLIKIVWTLYQLVSTVITAFSAWKWAQHKFQLVEETV